MISYSAHFVFSEKHQRLRDYAEKLVRDIVEAEPGTWRCHEIARVLFLRLGLKAPARIVDGTYAGCDHSWIELAGGTILDPYAVARLPMVQLVDVTAPTLQRNQYVAGPPRDDVRYEILQELLQQARVRV